MTPIEELEIDLALARQHANELWSLADEYTQLANEAEKHCEELNEQLEEAKKTHD